jgi:phosphocarrier protein
VNKVGVHARPASRIAQTASRFSCEITIHNGRHEANAKSIMGLLGLAASCGTELVLRAEGADAEDALREIEELFTSGFGEE